MKEVYYIPTQIGNNPKNPLVDLDKEDLSWIYTELMRSMGVFAKLNQQKNELWTDVTKRYPKRFSRGQLGPNSLFSISAGILGNYVENNAKYTNSDYRLSERQLEDLELVFLCLHHLDPSFTPVKFRQRLLEFV